MTEAPGLYVDGFEELLLALQESPETITPLIRKAMLNSLLLLQGGLRRIPNASEANSPTRRKWYERGYGMRWRLTDGGIGGEKTSEQLPKRWTVRTRVWPNGAPDVDFDGPMIEGVVGNNASYARLVQARDDQKPWHKRRGWPTVEGVLDENEDAIVDEFDDAVDTWVKDFNEGG